MEGMSESTTTPYSPVRVGVLDNDSCALECIVALLARLNTPNRQIDAWASNNPAQAIQECRFCVRRTNVILVDMALNGLTGAQIAARLRRDVPDIGIIGMTAYQPELYREQLHAAGAQALLDKSTLRKTLPLALDAVSRGLAYPADGGFDSVVQSRMAASDETAKRQVVWLTVTERRVLSLSMSSMNTREIAQTLHVSADTVFSHRRNIKNKLHSNTWYDVMDLCRSMHIA